MEGACTDIDERARNAFMIGGTVIDAWHNSRTRVALNMVVNFLATRSPLAVVVNGGMSRHGVEVSIQALNGSCKTSLNLPSLVCSRTDDQIKLPAFSANVNMIREGDACFSCQLPLLSLNDARIGGQRVVFRPCGALYHESCYSKVLRETNHAGCPACPSTEKRLDLSKSFGMSFIPISDLYDWLEMRLPADFCANAFIPSMCNLCGLQIINGSVSRPFPCDCFAHNVCTLLACSEMSALRSCAGCGATAHIRAYPQAIKLYHPSRAGSGALNVSADYVAQ